MIFEGLDNWDQYGYRADVTNTDNDDVDDCEGTGLGGNGKYTGQLNAGEDGQVTVLGEIDALCPSNTYILTVTLIADGGYTYTATQAFQVVGLSLSPIETATPTATATNTPEPTATATNPPPQQQPPRQARAANRHGHQYEHADRDGHESAAAETAADAKAAANAKAAAAAKAANRHAYRHGNRSADTHAYCKNLLCAAPESGRADADADTDAYADRHRPANANADGYALRYPGPNPYAHGHTYGRAQGPAHR